MIYTRKITPQDSAAIDRASHILDVSFENHDMMRAMNGAPGDIPELGYWRSFAAVTTSAIDLEAWVGSVEPGDRVDCVMLVKPPGIEHGKYPHASGSHTEKMNALVEGHPHKQESAKRLGAVFREISHEAFGDARFTDTYYISHLGTAPEMERRGLAGGMIRELVERAHGEGREVTLVTMTPELAAFYTRLGFKCRAEKDCPLPSEHGEIPTHWWVFRSQLPVEK